MRPCFFRLTTVVVAVLAAALAACGDDLTDPGAVLASAEAEAVMRSATALPSLPELVQRVQAPTSEQQATLYRALELWDAGVAADGLRGDARRRLAVSRAAPILASALSDEAWAEVRSRIEDWEATASGMIRHIPMPAVEHRLEAARRQLARADGSATSRTRIYHLLMASSELVETTPRFVARSLAAEAETAARKAESRMEVGPPRTAGAAAAAGGGAGSVGGEVLAPEALARARRLTDWATRAVEEEEYLLAIQRAYYAIQLAEGR